MVEKQQSSPEPGGDPQVSIVIPVYNEEGILARSINEIINGCDELGISYELILCENGSTDRTPQIAEQLCQEFSSLHLLRYPEPNYGGALQEGIRQARGENIVCFEIDFYFLQ